MPNAQNANDSGHIDFSQNAMNRAVFRASLQRPTTVYSTCAALGLLGTSAIVAPIMPGVAGFSAVAGSLLFLTGLGRWGIDFLFRRNAIAGEYIKQVHHALEAKRVHDIEAIQGRLRPFLQLKGAEQYTAQALEQYQRIQKRSNDFQDLLETKLHEGELTFSRYLGAVEQVIMAIFDNIRRIVNALQSVNHIDIDYIQDRLNKLNQLPQKAQADVEEEQTLRQRLGLRQQQLEKINELLTYNEKAMTEFDRLTIAVSEMNTETPLAASNLETSIHDLQNLAQRAHIYQ